MERTPKTLYYDIETTPNLGYGFGVYDVHMFKVLVPSYIMCFSYAWNDGKVKNIAQSDFPARFKLDKYNDYDVVKELHNLIAQADIVIGYNATGFDNKVANTRFLIHNLEAVPPYKTVDPLKTTRSKFKFKTNKLNDVADQLGLGQKTGISHGDVWFDCVNGDKKAWKLMKAYCDQDVVLVRDVYKKLLPYITNHPNIALLSQRPDVCPKCGGKRLHASGTRTTTTTTYQRYKCADCGSWTSDRKLDKDYQKPTYVSI